MTRVVTSVSILTSAVFLTGLAENIFIGVLPDVARGLSVSEARASTLVSVFSLTYALYAPFAAVVAFHVNTRRALIGSLAVFVLGNLPVLLPDAGLLSIASFRVVTAMACAQISVCAVICVVNLVQERYRARAIGVVYLGISGSLFLGVPVGVWSWRSGCPMSSLPSGKEIFGTCSSPICKTPGKPSVSSSPFCSWRGTSSCSPI